MSRYMKPQVVRAAPQGPVSVTGYSNGRWWVFPHPDKPDVVEPVESAYRQGTYTEKEIFLIDQRTFDDPASWSP